MLPLLRSHVPAVVVLLLAMGLRIPALWTTPFWVDEAESAINALTILEHGYPTDHFLGLPLFENMLVRPWPEHPEYEFRDISYSDRGMAVYHGWLPLYAIAASFRAFDVAPPAPEQGWEIRADVADMKRRTAAARFPSLLLSGIFLIALYRAANRMAGHDAALCVLVLAGLSSSLVTVGSFARYHAATLAWSALAAGGVWRVIRRGRRRDYTILGAVLVLLFHTHMFAFVSVAAVAVLAVGFQAGERARLARAALMFAATGAACLPWFVLSGFAEHLRVVSQGPALLDPVLDLRDYAIDRIPFTVAYAVGGAWLLVVFALHGRHLPRRLLEPWQRHGVQYLLLLSWMGTATALWLWLTPPASAWPDRLSLCLFVPGMLLLSLLVADACRMLTHRSVVLAPFCAAAFLVAAGLFPPRPVSVDAFAMIADTLDAVGRLGLPPSARVYASPNAHLIFAFYGQRPIQSLAPVRKAVLDTHPDDVVFIEMWLYPEFAHPNMDDVRRAARRHGVALSDQEAGEWVRRLSTTTAARAVASRVGGVVPPLVPLPAFAEDAVADAEAEQAPYLAEEVRRFGALPVFRGYPFRNGTDLWTTFAYRLVDPPSRSGRHLNGYARFTCGTAVLVPESNFVVYHSPAPCG